MDLESLQAIAQELRYLADLLERGEVILRLCDSLPIGDGPIVVLVEYNERFYLVEPE